MKWIECRPEWRDLLEDYLAGRLAPELIKENRRRTVHRVSRRGQVAFVKIFRASRLKSWIRNPAAHESDVLRHVAAMGVNAARPVAHGRDGAASILVTEEVRDARPLRDAFTPAQLPALAFFVRALHDAGVRHDDLHIGNILVNGKGLHLVDVGETRLKRVTAAERIEGLAFMLHSVYTLITLTRANAFIHAYEDGRSADFVRKVWDAFQDVRRGYWKDRTGRCLEESTEFAVDGPWRLRKPVTRTEAERLLSGPGHEVKKLKNRGVRVVGDRFVKSGPRALDQWVNARGLEVRRLPTPKLWAARPGHVIGEWRPSAEPLWDHVRKLFPERKRRERQDFLHRLARQVRKLHHRGVFHHDLKANNVLADDTGFWFIDLDRVTFRREIGTRERCFNLAQLNAAVGEPVTRTERLRFYLYYAGNDREWRMSWKRNVREIMRMTVARKHHWPRAD